MFDPQVYLQAMYKEQCDQARQHEVMRQQSTTLILTLSGGLAAVEGSALAATVTPLIDAKVPWVVAVYAILGWIVIKLANLGQNLSLKHYERNKLHVARARQYRERLNNLFPESDFSRVNKDADVQHAHEWTQDALPVEIINRRLHPYWVSIYEFVRYLGVALTVLPIVLAIVLTSLFYLPNVH